MKLIIRDEKPGKEKTCEIWLEDDGDGGIDIMSSRTKGRELIEVALSSDMTASRIDGGNFTWE